MNQINQRTEMVRDLENQVQEHSMCLNFSFDGRHYLVQYPDGYFPEGVRADASQGKMKTLEKILEVMERHYQENSLFE